MRPTKCKVCGDPYEKLRPLQKVCGFQCALSDAVNTREKKERKQLAVSRERLKTITKHLREAQYEFNRWIRHRDRNRPCISSGRPLSSKYDAGHYRTVKAAPQLRFNEDNCHAQSVHDNQHLSGNVLEYRIGLIERIGVQRVELLENDNGYHKYTIEEAKKIKADYKQRLKIILSKL